MSEIYLSTIVFAMSVFGGEEPSSDSPAQTLLQKMGKIKANVETDLKSF